MFDWLVEKVSSSAITYVVVLIASGGDVLFPFIPSETMVITAGVVAANSSLSVVVVALAAAVGAFAGDNVSYWLGRRVGDPIARRLFRGDTGRARLEWAERAMQRRGAVLIFVGRFIPGGRTASTFAAGTLEMSWRRFAVIDAFAVSAWAVYASLLGFVGGSTFEDSGWKPLVASLGAAALLMLGVEVWRQLQKRRGRDILGDPID